MAELASCFKNFGDVARNRGFQFPRGGVEGFEFLVQRFPPFLSP